MKLVYIAGPYRANTKEGITANIKKAQTMGLTVATSGHEYGLFPVIPHMNTAHFEHHSFLVTEMSGGFVPPVPPEYWLHGALALMEKCDAVLLVHPHAGLNSEGTRAEIKRAIELGIPVYVNEGMLLHDAKTDEMPKRSINALDNLYEYIGDD